MKAILTTRLWLLLVVVGDCHAFVIPRQHLTRQTTTTTTTTNSPYIRKSTTSTTTELGVVNRLLSSILGITNDGGSSSSSSSSNSDFPSTPSSAIATAAATGTVVAAGTAAATVAAGTAAKSSTASNGFLGGALSGIVSKLFISPARMGQVLWTVARFALDDWKDWILIALCCTVPLPLARTWYGWRFRGLQLDEAPMDQKFKRSKTKKVAQIVTELGELFAILFGTELFLVMLKELGFQFVSESPIHKWATGIIATVWFAKNVSELKRYILSKVYRKSGIAGSASAGTSSKLTSGTRLINRMLDILIVVATALAILDFLSVKTGLAMRSLLGFSTFGTLVFSLASQNLASEFLASLAIQGTNMYQEGEIIVVDNVATGLVQKLGWLHTHIRLGDDSIVRVPNTQIAGTRIANVSRQKLSNVKVTLDISYQEISKLPALLQQIKTNIVDAMATNQIVEYPEDVLVMDGSRPFRIHWRDVTESSVQIVVDTHLRVRPFCNEYWDLRQAMLFAIAKATESADIKFAYKDKNKMLPPGSFPMIISTTEDKEDEETADLTDTDLDDKASLPSMVGTGMNGDAFKN
mmetsp:Transcript_13789/g.23947  ORF Transcript_13789/g.23947 Transcript_13789/m.23947 type:complete len:581 (+) Transcript_13789:83-1825(+)